jgi:hypothetical protein
MGTTTMLLSDVDRHEVVVSSEFWWLQLLYQFHLRSSFTSVLLGVSLAVRPAQYWLV